MKFFFFINNDKDRATDLQINYLKMETNDLNWKTNINMCIYVYVA